MQQQNRNTTHIQLNGNNNMGLIGMTGINVKPIVLQTRAQSLNPTIRVSKFADEISRQTNTVLGKSGTHNIENSKSGTISSAPSKSLSISRKISVNFSSRIVLRAKTKTLDSDSAKYAHIQNTSLGELSSPSHRLALPPIKEKYQIKMQTTCNSDTESGVQVFQFKNKESQLKKRNFDFLERTKVKNQSQETDLLKLHRYFRSKFSTLITGTGKKHYYLQFLRNMKDLATKVKNYEKLSKQTQQVLDVMNKLKKIVATRAKYKYREKIDFERSIIMRTLGYESRHIIQQIKENMTLEKEEYEDLEDEGDREQEELNKKKLEISLDKNSRKDLISPEIIANWKKMRGYSPNQKVFIIIGQYSDLKSKLKDNGWIENPNPESLVFDLKWVTKKKDVDKDLLLDQQITNHFQKNHNLTSKSGIALNLRNLIWYDNIDIDTFYPRCFDLSDFQDFEDFIEEFKYTQAESILKLFIKSKLPSETKAKPFEKYLRTKLLIACIALKRRTYSFESKINLIGQNNLPVISPEEWSLLNKTDNNYSYLEQNPQIFNQLQQQITREMDSEESNSPDLTKICEKYLKLSEQYDPQYALNEKNMWIVKPAGLSRGRGIRAFDQLEPLINYIIGKDVMWVAQKYMENPLTINKKKFDIRQWVMVTEWNPLTIYFYDDCYIRICFDEYNSTDLQNKFAHLANNCISKHAENFEDKINDTMMYLPDFVDYIKQREGGKDMFYSKIQKEMIEIVINSIKSCKDSVEHRKNSFELYGYDFMVDEDYNTWLIEINSSPSMEYSTLVTTKLVKKCMEDTASLIHEHFCENEKRFRKDSDFGQWKSIYREQK